MHVFAAAACMFACVYVWECLPACVCVCVWEIFSWGAVDILTSCCYLYPSPPSPSFTLWIGSRPGSWPPLPQRPCQTHATFSIITQQGRGGEWRAGERREKRQRRGWEARHCGPLTIDTEWMIKREMMGGEEMEMTLFRSINVSVYHVKSYYVHCAQVEEQRMYLFIILNFCMHNLIMKMFMILWKDRYGKPSLQK